MNKTTRFLSVAAVAAFAAFGAHADDKNTRVSAEFWQQAPRPAVTLAQ